MLPSGNANIPATVPSGAAQETRYPTVTGALGLPEAALRWLSSCPTLCGSGFLPDAAWKWLPARFNTAVASCPMRRGPGGGFLPDEAQRWLLALRGGRGAAVASCQRLRGGGFLPSEGWRVSKFRTCRSRCGESRTNVDKCSEYRRRYKNMATRTEQSKQKQT